MFSHLCTCGCNIVRMGADRHGLSPCVNKWNLLLKPGLDSELHFLSDSFLALEIGVINNPQRLLVPFTH